MDKHAGPVLGLRPRGRTGPSDSPPIRYSAGRGVLMLLKRVEEQICRDIFRLRSLIHEAESCHVRQEMFRRLIVKREEMLKAVRAEMRTGS